MKVREALAYRDILNSDSVIDLVGGKFTYAADKNDLTLLHALQKARKESGIDETKAIEFDKKRKEIQLAHCKKDEDGKPVIEGRVYVGLQENAEFDEAMEKLSEEYKDLQEKNSAFMNQDIDIKIHMVKPEHYPVNLTRRISAMVGFMLE